MLISSYALLLTHSFSSVTIAYFLLTNPSAVLSSAFSPVWILGESMHVREPALKWSASPSEPLAALALVLLLTGITQAIFAAGLAAAAVPHPVGVKADGKSSSVVAVDAGELGEKVYTLRYAQNQWMGLAGLRVLLMGALVSWIYLFHSDRGQPLGVFSRAPKAGFGLLANRVVFSAAMMDMLFWGYLWTGIREEGRELAVMVANLREAREEE